MSEKKEMPKEYDYHKVFRAIMNLAEVIEDDSLRILLDYTQSVEKMLKLERGALADTEEVLGEVTRALEATSKHVEDQDMRNENAVIISRATEALGTEKFLFGKSTCPTGNQK